MESHPINLENLNKQLESQKRFTDSTTWWSIPSGVSSVRILPPWDATGRIAIPILHHNIEYRDETMKYTRYKWTCMNKTFGKSCQICEALDRMRNAGVSVEEYEPNRTTYYMNIMVMYDPVYQEGLKKGVPADKLEGLATGTVAVARIPKTVYDWIISQITSPLVGDITNLHSGIDVILTKEGTGLGTKYSPTLSPNGRTAIPSEFLDKAELYNLEELFSRGHDDEMIGKLIQKIQVSALNLGGQVQQTVNQMSGYGMNPYAPQTAPQYAPVPNSYQPQTPQNYPQQPVYQVPPQQQQPVYQPPVPVTQPPVFQNPPVQQPVYQMPDPVQAAPVPQQDVQVPMSMPVNPTQPEQPVSATPVQGIQEAVETSRPKCYGNYNSADVTCVVCPHEVDCTKVS